MLKQMPKQQAIERLESFRRNGYLLEGSQICKAIDMAIDALKQSMVESEKQHGRWIECCNELNKKCSCCDKVYGTIYKEEPFCPNCGARMNEDIDNI